MESPRWWQIKTGWAETTAILIGMAVFWTLMFLPFPEGPHRTFIIQILVITGNSLNGINYQIGTSIDQGNYGPLLFIALVVVDGLCFWAGMFLAGTQLTWWGLDARTRGYLWDALGAISLVGWGNISVVLFMAQGWPAETPYQFQFTLIGAGMLAYYVVAALAFGHLGAILFRRRKAPPA